MSSAVAELDGYLQSMLSQKPPGVSGSKINSITILCDANVQSESVLIQKIYTHFKKAPGTHKLGVLYVVDSVTRRWVEQARKAGQPSGSNAPDGTFAAGVNRVSELLPVLMNDIIQSAPEDQKDKIKKLVDIWERSSTFPAAMLNSFKQRLNAPPQNMETTTPEGSPAPDFIPLNQTQAPVPPPAQDTSAILAALANMAKTNQSAVAASGIPTLANSNIVLNPQNTVPHATPSVDRASMPSNAQAVNPYAGTLSSIAGMSNGAINPTQNQIPNQNPFQSLLNGQQNPLASLMSQANTGAAAAAPPDPQLQQVQVLQYLIAQGIPQDQWAPVLQALAASSGNPNAPALSANAASAPANWQQQNGGQTGWGVKNEAGSRDADGRRDFGRSPPNPYRRRSRSPGWDRRREASPPGRRGSPVYGDYSGDSPGRSRGDPRGRGGRSEYRQRSPPGRRRRSPSPAHKGEELPSPGPKFLEWDYTIGQGNIKVLSRTLFVGGVTSSEAHLKSLFSQYGMVQTCIVNIDKRHAFVKMINRADAVAARDGMEQYKSGDMQLRTRWGVGFGPRDCSDYQTGISVIPIERLTDADRKWMLTAEYGGSGGRPIETGMVVEEPDIEIGAGVSSKAISRRMATDQGGKRGPQSSRGNDRFRRDRNDGGGSGPSGSHDRDRNSNPNHNAIGVAPAVPGFGFNFSGMHMLPQNFMMGTPGASSNPPGT